MTKPLYFYNGSTFELVGPTTPQSPIAYQTSAPTAPATGDIWIDSDGDVDTYNRQLTRYYFVATASQTTITGTDANNLTLAYVAGSEAVYVNGALQVRGQDYTATNGTSVVMSSALAVNDVVEIFAYTAFTVANAYTKTETDGLVSVSSGLKLLTPTSVAVGSGTATIGTSGTVTFSGASSISLNGIFSSTYDNYRIIMNQTSNSTGATMRLRMRSGSTDNSGNNYALAGLYTNSGSATIASWRDAIGTLSSWYIGDYATSRPITYTLEFYNPFVATQTVISAASGYNTTADVLYAYQHQGLHNQATSYDAITLFASSGTVTGTVSVYGYKD